MRPRLLSVDTMTLPLDPMSLERMPITQEAVSAAVSACAPLVEGKAFSAPPRVIHPMVGTRRPTILAP